MVLKQNDGAQTERWCSHRTMVLKQNDGAQTERWCSNRTMVLTQNDGAHTERWCSDRTMVLKQNDGAQIERWCSNRTMVLTQNDGAQTERWCSNRTMVLKQNDGAQTERWCSHRTMALLFPTPPHPTPKEERKTCPREVGIFLGIHMRGNPGVVVLVSWEPVYAMCSFFSMALASPWSVLKPRSFIFSKNSSKSLGGQCFLDAGIISRPPVFWSVHSAMPPRKHGRQQGSCGLPQFWAACPQKPELPGFRASELVSCRGLPLGWTPKEDTWIAPCYLARWEVDPGLPHIALVWAIPEIFKSYVNFPIVLIPALVDHCPAELPGHFKHVHFAVIVDEIGRRWLCHHKKFS